MTGVQTCALPIYEPDARPISKGRLGKPTEFGYKAKVVDNTDGIILDYSVHIGNPSDTGLLRPAICRVVELLATKPVLVTADRGYWDTKIEADLATAGVTTIVDPAHRETIQGPRRDRTRRHFHRRDQMAHRMRRTDLTPQTRLRLATHRTAQSQRRTHLVCPRRIHPQPHQDQHDQQRPAPTMTLSEPPEPRNSAQTNSSALKNPIHSQRLTIEPING